ncbi:MAG: helix-turn-helix domain-containing protein [Nanoarchaeota archaeon]|nr:helix-turn-helix domain-containing protein [Nanoarchaeota archaeon]MBU1445084.1 helix-turn-helix domain-containing protein [Nanoarchaeota archaeon]MBU2406829.1 helix-turn-helix domain-containing protein [Nanoarchaeota archaeon]MBU2420339.1 helix-turn-helix domain-containing protein [Nanoarchaeota archaeon]MBU2474947.1 helix-turn-helix domain-containing protein [Nanoarchaeota archaeon]
MKSDKFLLLSLNQKESKSLAQTLSNDTARKILDYLTEKEEASASEISKKLNIPLPTVDYNLKQLVKTDLVESKEFLWSKKGREMNLYRLAKKLVIIAPRSTSLKEIKNLLPIGIISVAAAFLIKLFTQSKQIFGAARMEYIDSAAQLAEGAPAGATDVQVINILPTLSQNWLWFLYGALFVILLVLIFTLVKKLRK